MEDSSEGISEENRVSPEKNIKRTLKTPAQVAALEEFYSEHKYPSEELKLEVGERIGLTEKQISSWFCHRRLKDKKKVEVNPGGRQERSGSVIQDRGSGLRQDSCGSTKQGDFRTGDLKEVESERLYRHDLQSTDLAYDHGRRYPGNAVSIGDSSPQSSTSLHEKSVSPRDDPYSSESRKFAKKNGDFTQPTSKIPNGVPFKPAGYLKVRGDIENAAITAVKRQLGRHYREDGPLLGVEFEPLPPGAFTSQRSFYAGDLMGVKSPEFQGGRKQSFLNTSNVQNCEVYTSKMLPEDPYHEEKFSGAQFEADFHEQRGGITEEVNAYGNCYSSRKSRLEFGENNGRGTMPTHGKRKKSSTDESKGKPGSTSILNHNRLNGQNLKGEAIEGHINDYTADNSSSIKRNTSMTKPSKKSSATTKPSSLSKLPKNKKAQGKQKTAKGNRENADDTKHSRLEFSLQETSKKDPFLNKSGKMNPIKGSAVEGPSSFRDGKTAETSSSGE